MKDEWQIKLAKSPLTMGYYRHRLGGAYVVYSQTCNEETGEILVHYFSVLFHRRWTRSRKVFLEVVDDRPRFEWWRHATLEELVVAACGGPEEVRRVFGGPATPLNNP